MMLRDASLLDSCTSDRCCFSSLFVGHECGREYDVIMLHIKCNIVAYYMSNNVAYIIYFSISNSNNTYARIASHPHYDDDICVHKKT